MDGPYAAAPQPLEPKPPSRLAGSRKFIILGALALGVAVIAAAVALRPSGPAQPATNNAAGNTNTATNQTTQPALQRFQAQLRNDRDSDGLTDNEEAQAQTNPELADSDGDGLTDGDEVNIYKTNPLSQDSDGDGMIDKQEIEAGRNPSGPGLLRDLPSAIKTLTNN